MSTYRTAIDTVGTMPAPLEKAEANVLTYLDFPAEHQRRIRTNNLLERMNREIKCRPRVIQAIPSAESMLRLVGAACAEQDEDRSSKRYISPESMGRPSGPEPPRGARGRAGGARLSSRPRLSSPTAEGGQRDAMMQMESGDDPTLEDELHQFFRHYRRGNDQQHE